MKKTTISILCLLLPALNAIAGIKIKGANGSEVEFTALFDARPAGLLALISPDSSAITIPWSKIDLLALKESQSEIFKSYETAIATQKDQPLGMGLASSMLSLSQLPDALKQAVKDPYNWPYSNYSYQTVYTDSSGKSVTRTYTNVATRYPNGYMPSNTPYIILKQLKNIQDDKQKKILFSSFKSSGYSAYGLNSMIERIDFVLGKIPPEKMFPRQPKEKILILSAIEFKKTIEAMQTADTLTADHQGDIKDFFSKIGIE